MKNEKKSRKSASVTIGEHLEAKGTVIPDKGNGEILPPATESENKALIKTNALNDDSKAKELAKVSAELERDRDKALDVIYSKLPTGMVGKFRGAIKGFVSDLRSSAQNLGSAMAHLYEAYTMAIAQSSELWQDTQTAISKLGYVPAGTLYTWTQKFIAVESLAERFDAMKDAKIRGAIMAYSQGDSIVVREELSKDDREAWKKQFGEASKPPKARFVPSPYFARAVETIEKPSKLTPDSVDKYAYQVVRLAASIRANARVNPGAQLPDGTQASKDDKQVTRLQNRLDNLMQLVLGSADKDYKDKFVIDNKPRQNSELVNVATAIVEATIQRLPMADVEKLWESIDELFTEAKDKAEKQQQKHAKTASTTAA